MLAQMLRVLEGILRSLDLDVFQTSVQPIPGIVTGVAYVSGDAFGRKMVFEVPVRGTISNVHFLDFDNEGKTKELVLFRKNFTDTADNAAFDPSDADSKVCVGVVSITQFFAFTTNQIGQGTPALAYIAPEGKLWGQWVTRGADNIAAGDIPECYLVIV